MNTIFESLRGIFTISIKAVVLSAAALMLSACVAGQSISLDHVPEEEQLVANNISVSVGVKDKRDYVESGDKSVDYIGHYRAGFGNTWDVSTQDDMALADLIATDLDEELSSLGFTAVKAGEGAKALDVQILDWNFDTYINGKFWYDIDVKVLSPSGDVLVSSRLQDQKEIKGSFWVGAKYAMEEGVPETYNEIISNVVRYNPPVLEALQAQ